MINLRIPGNLRGTPKSPHYFCDPSKSFKLTFSSSGLSWFIFLVISEYLESVFSLFLLDSSHSISLFLRHKLTANGKQIGIVMTKIQKNKAIQKPLLTVFNLSFAFDFFSSRFKMLSSYFSLRILTNHFVHHNTSGNRYI